MKIKFTGVLILVVLVVAVSSCHKHPYNTMSTKATKKINYRHPGHKAKQKFARPRYYRKNGFW